MARKRFPPRRNEPFIRPGERKVTEKVQRWIEDVEDTVIVVEAATSTEILSADELLGQVANLQEELVGLKMLVLQANMIAESAKTHYNSVTTTVDYVSADFDFVNAKRGAKITLPQYPAENATVIIRNGDGRRITIDGNDKDINGSATATIDVKGTAVELHYFIADDEWFAR